MDFKRTFAGMQIQRLLRWKKKKKKKKKLRCVWNLPVVP